MLPECQLRGKFLTSHRTNKQCTPLPLIKGGVSADRESGGGRGEGKGGIEGEREVGMEEGEAREKGEEETGDLVLSKKMLLALLLCPRP